VFVLQRFSGQIGLYNVESTISCSTSVG